MELTPQQHKKLLAAADIVEHGDMAVLTKILEFQDTIEEKETKISELADKVEKSVSEFKQTTADALEHIHAIEKGGEGEPGKPGEDYVLTEQDKNEIAEKIKVPIVEKITERTETIRELPTVTEITKEIAVVESADKIRDKLESLPSGERLRMSAIEELDETIATLQNRTQLLNQIATQGQRSSSGGTAFRVTEVDGSPSVSNPTAIKFSNGSVTDNGDGTVTITTGAGGGGDVSSNTATSVDSEVALFSGTGGKTIKRATGTGFAYLTSGVLSAITPIDNEIVSGSGTTFTLANTPVVGSVHVYALGQRLTPTNDFSISGAAITTVNSWSTGDILADYRK